MHIIVYIKVEKHIDLIMSRVSEISLFVSVQYYVESKGFTVLNVKCVSHNEAKNCSFKFTVPVSEFDKLFDSSVWPEDISICRFRLKHA